MILLSRPLFLRAVANIFIGPLVLTGLLTPLLFLIHVGEAAVREDGLCALYTFVPFTNK